MALATGGDAATIAGGCALFAGADSPFTHALGLGMSGVVTSEEVDRLEEFYFSRGSDCLIDLCPLADAGLVQAVTTRGYQVIEFNNLMVRAIVPEDEFYAAPESLQIHRAGDDEMKLWGWTVASGFSGLINPPPELVALSEPLSQFGEAWLADGGGAALSFAENVALFFGDATVMSARGRGIQTALIRARLARAAVQGADFAMATVIPGSGSHRNYERAGFRLLYMRVNVRRPKP